MAKKFAFTVIHCMLFQATLYFKRLATGQLWHLTSLWSGRCCFKLLFWLNPAHLVNKQPCGPCSVFRMRSCLKTASSKRCTHRARSCAFQVGVALRKIFLRGTLGFSTFSSSCEFRPASSCCTCPKTPSGRCGTCGAFLLCGPLWLQGGI